MAAAADDQKVAGGVAVGFAASDRLLFAERQIKTPDDRIEYVIKCRAGARYNHDFRGHTRIKRVLVQFIVWRNRQLNPRYVIGFAAALINQPVG